MLTFDVKRMKILMLDDKYLMRNIKIQIVITLQNATNRTNLLLKHYFNSITNGYKQAKNENCDKMSSKSVDTQG